MKTLMALMTVVIVGVFSSGLVHAKIKLIAFDAFPIFDPRPVFKVVRQIYPKKGDAIVQIWKTKQFSYSWLRASGEQYKNFWDVTEESLLYATKSVGVSLNNEQKKRIMNTYLNLQPWPEVLSSLQELKRMGFKLTFLSNFTNKMLDSSMSRSHLRKFFSDTILSTDIVKTFKPKPRAYEMAMDKFRLKKEEILFVPFAAWDVVGAKWFGYKTFWVNRAKQPRESLGPSPDGEGSSLEDLVRYIKK